MTPVIGLFEEPSSSVRIPQKEIWRYLGYRGSTPDGTVLEQISETLEIFQKTVQYKACYAKTEILKNEEGDLVFPFGTVQAEALKKNLEGCTSAWVFCATAGIAVDRMISRFGVSNPSKSVIADAIATAGIEAFCDMLCDWFPHPEFLRPRFSPGYGDLSLEYQQQVLRYLDAGRKINVQLTQSLMMVPVKSVTAIAGIGKEVCTIKKGCAQCTQKNCVFRRIGK